MSHVLGFRRHTTRMSVIAAFALFLSLVTGATAASSPPLGTLVGFAVLGGSTVTNTGSTLINGNLGVSPGSAITGFPPGVVINGTQHAADAVASQAQSDLTAAYVNLTGQGCTANLTGQDLGGMTLIPGVYCFDSSAQLTGVLTLDGQGSAGSVFIFKMGSTITTASASSVVFIRSASFCNVYWQVGSSATLGTGTHFAGNIMALTSITLTTGAQVLGRTLARNGAVTLDSNFVSPGGCGEGSPPAVAPPPAPPAQVPEGDTLMLVATGLAGLAGYAGLRMRARKASRR